MPTYNPGRRHHATEAHEWRRIRWKRVSFLISAVVILTLGVSYLAGRLGAQLALLAQPPISAEVIESVRKGLLSLKHDSARQCLTAGVEGAAFCPGRRC